MTDPQPDYGPGGYLPERAARRARKIILRERMGMGWPLAAVVAGVVLLVAGTSFVLTRTGPPGPPFSPVAELTELASGAVEPVALDGADILLLRTAGGVRAFAAPAEPVAWCQASGRLEGADGAVWDASGRAVGGDADSLGTYPVQIHTGTVYVDATARVPGPPPAAGTVTPGCR